MRGGGRGKFPRFFYRFLDAFRLWSEGEGEEAAEEELAEEEVGPSRFPRLGPAMVIL